MKMQPYLAIFLISTIAIGPNLSVALADTSVESLHKRPPNIPARSNAEYYSPSPDSTIVMPVNIWGNVKEPGLHYLPPGSNLHQSVSAAGGPSDTADLSSVRILRGGKTSYADLLGPKSVPLQENDYVYVDRNYRNDLPIWFSGISTVVSIVTLYYVMNQRKQ